MTKYKVKCPILGQNEKFDLYLDNGNELLLLIDITRYDDNVDLLALLTVITCIDIEILLIKFLNLFL